MLLGPIISRLFTCSNAEKNNFKKTKGACSSPVSMVAGSRGTNLELENCKFKVEKLKVKAIEYLIYNRTVVIQILLLKIIFINTQTFQLFTNKIKTESILKSFYKCQAARLGLRSLRSCN